MIRDRLKSVAKKAVLKAFNMEWDAAEVRDGGTRKTESVFDPDKIPKVVDGSGDTPGPNHKEDIGRPWVAAQLASGVSPFIIDLRPPAEVVSGMLPGAILLPGEQIKQNLHRLPAKDIRVTVYDQTGYLGSETIALWLRKEGWTMARRLRGGYAEWLEHNEVITVPSAPAGAAHRVGDPVRLKDGRSGYVQEITTDGGAARYTVWISANEVTGPLGADALAP